LKVARLRPVTVTPQHLQARVAIDGGEGAAASAPVRESSAVHARGQEDELIVIDAGQHWAGLQLRELWHARELVGFLVWRDVTLRYKQTVLGVAWAVLQPLLTMVVFTVFFGRLAGVPSDGMPYALFTFTALVPWTLFSFGLGQATHSVVGSQQLVTKVYFPRLAIPLAAVLSGAVDFALASTLLFAMMLFYGITPTIHILWLPALAVLTLLTALGAGLWLAALNVQYRDVRYVVPFLTQLWLFATPIAYSGTLLHEPWRTIYGINPMAGVVEAFRWAVLASGPVPVAMLTVSVIVTVIMVITGVVYFQRVERTFADVI
jgi:lipopolysaccharide transport system permease protein